MYSLRSRAVGVTLGVMLTVLAACQEDSAPTAPIPPTAPTRQLEPQSAAGDVLLVTNLSGGTEVGSLRWAVNQLSGGEVIRFAPALAGQTILLDSTVVIREPVTIEGPADKGITISGGGKMRVLDASAEMVLRNLTIANGQSFGEAGAGVLVRAGFNFPNTLRVENSTFTGNVANWVPAISGGVHTTLINTTVSGNTATSTTDNIYGAIHSYNLTLVNSTVAHNSSQGVSSGNLVLRNSIISNHAGKSNCRSLEGGTRTYQGTNITDDDTCGSPSQLMIAPPLLALLADNGGPTRTHALKVGSPAINTGSSCNVSVDQRYVPRDAPCDVGAFEFTDFTTVELTTAANAIFDQNGRPVLTGTVRCSRHETFELYQELHQDQKIGKRIVDVHSASTVPVECSPSLQTWSAPMHTTDEPFQAGSAVATVGTLNTAKWVTPASITWSVKLVRARK